MRAKILQGVNELNISFNLILDRRFACLKGYVLLLLMIFKKSIKYGILYPCFHCRFLEFNAIAWKVVPNEA